MLFFAVFLLPLVTAVLLKAAQNYILIIENGTLKNVQLVGELSSVELDLSGRGLRSLEKSAFDNVPHLKSLNLANNSLKTIPDFIFSNLTELEHLSLAENQIEQVKYLFVGLDSLKVLNISHNPITHLRRGHLYGVTKAVNVLTEGNVFWSISTGVFENSFLKEEEELQQIGMTSYKKNPLDRCEKQEREMDTLLHDKQVAAVLQSSKKNPRLLFKNLRLILCSIDNVVTSLGILNNSKELPSGCLEAPYDGKEKNVNLRGLGIEGFQKNWYQLQSLPIASIDLSDNKITEITKHTLNDLPGDLVYVNLSGNRVRRIRTEAIENPFLKMLNFKDNQIELIEEDALRKTNLTGLFLTGNRLMDINFASSLPKTLTEFVVSGNRIDSIPNGVFSNLSRLFYLNLGNNKIVRLPNSTFVGLDSLHALILTRNRISEIEPEAFKGLKMLRILYIYRNAINNLPKGVFSHLESLQDLNLAWNKLSKVPKEMFANISRRLDFLHLDDNEIEFLEEGNFVEVPKLTLSLSHNKISNIPRGSFELPTLQDLYLNGNNLSAIDEDGYEGLPHLKHLWLSENQIAKIQKGSCKNLGSLDILDISRNPFERLENGALHGIRAGKGTFLYIYENHLKLLQGGLFEEV